MHGGDTLSSSTMFRSNAGDLVLGKALNHCSHRSRMSHVSKQSSFILDGLDAARSPALEIHPLQVLAKTSLIAVFDADLKLADEFFKEPLHSLEPHTLKAFLICF